MAIAQSTPGRHGTRTRAGASPQRLCRSIPGTSARRLRKTSSDRGRTNSAWIWSWARRTVAVEATILGRTWRLSISRTHRPSIAASYRPAIVPSGPAIRCSSSWMTRSGGGQGRRESSAAARFCGSVEAARVMAIGAAEEGTRRPDPRKCRELIHRGDQERRQPAVGRLVHSHHRKRAIARELALKVRTDDPQLARLVIVRPERERVRLKPRATPGTVLERDRRRLAPGVVLELTDLASSVAGAFVPPVTEHVCGRCGAVHAATP